MAEQYFEGGEFLARLIRGETDPLAPDAVARIAILWSRYRGLDAGMGDLCRRAFEAHHAALERAEEAADRAYLRGLIDGSVEPLSIDTFPRLEPMFAKYPEGSDMFALLEKAAIAFSDAAQSAAYWVMAECAINDARRRARGEDVDD